ncbi:MAG: response regulator [Verrucomicrobiota bacterium]
MTTENKGRDVSAGGGRSDVILLVEDNPDDQVLTERALRANGIQNPIVIARDGVEAVKYLSEQGPDRKRLHGLPRLILLDLGLPKVSGLQVLDYVRRDPETKGIPIVVLTASAEDRDYMESRDLGAKCYVEKPVNFDEFIAMVRRMWPLWLEG